MENDESPSNMLVSLPIPGINLGGPPGIAEAIWVTALPDPPIDAPVMVSEQPIIEESAVVTKVIDQHAELFANTTFAKAVEITQPGNLDLVVWLRRELQDAVETLTRDGAPYSAGTAALAAQVSTTRFDASLLDRIGAATDATVDKMTGIEAVDVR